MPYVTVRMKSINHQVTFDDLFKTTNKENWVSNNTAATRTFYTEKTNCELKKHFEFDSDNAIMKLYNFNQQYKHLIDCDKSTLYNSFSIPKKSGGLRKIDAPNQELKCALYDLVRIFKEDLYALYHTSAFAYVNKRSHVDALKKHQYNKSKWFLKLDFTNFFGSTTFDFTQRMLSEIFPFCVIMNDEYGKKELVRALSLAFLNGGLPQGTPMSPMLTNLIMIPIDAEITKKMREGHYIYTRYADDIQISSQYDFNPREMENEIRNILKKFDAPYVIKPEKTRYGSTSGRNWNLGLMLNKDNEITIGHKRKREFKAMLTNYALDKIKGVQWDIHDIQVVLGLYSYYSSIEKDSINNIIETINKKRNMDVIAVMKAEIS